MSVYLHAKFQVSSITLTSFRHEGGGIGEGGLVSFIPPFLLSFLGKDFAQNVAIVGADNIFSNHSENCVDNFLILDEGY